MCWAGAVAFPLGLVGVPAEAASHLNTCKSFSRLVLRPLLCHQPARQTLLYHTRLSSVKSLHLHALGAIYWWLGQPGGALYHLLHYLEVKKVARLYRFLQLRAPCHHVINLFAHDYGIRFLWRIFRVMRVPAEPLRFADGLDQLTAPSPWSQASLSSHISDQPSHTILSGGMPISFLVSIGQ